MGNPSAAQEPSMEEILASIRQIISEDGDKAEDEAGSPEGGEAATGESDAGISAAPATADEPPQPSARAEAEAEAPPVPAPAAEKPQPQRSESLLRRQPEAGAGQASEAFAPAAVAAAEPRGGAPGIGLPAAGDDRRLLSPQTDATVSGAFSALAHTILAQNARTLEDLVSEMLRPMLKDWLDDNLPQLVERLVKEEIERVSRGRR